MKDYRTPQGERRLWFDDAEIEDAMEEQLRRAGLLPAAPGVVDLERLVERHLGAPLDQYADLDEGVLGETSFDGDGQCAVRISRALTHAVDDEDCPPGVRGRWRATLAHEAAHIILHRRLFLAPSSQGSLFDEPRVPRLREVRRCAASDVAHTRSVQVSDWREVQANKGMAALLMPRGLFSALTRDVLGTLPGAPLTLSPTAPELSALVERIAREFSVSKHSAAIRLETLGFVRRDGQRPLL